MAQFGKIGKRKLQDNKHWAHVMTFYTDDIFTISPEWLVAAATPDTCRSMRGPKYSSVWSIFCFRFVTSTSSTSYYRHVTVCCLYLPVNCQNYCGLTAPTSGWKRTSFSCLSFCWQTFTIHYGGSQATDKVMIRISVTVAVLLPDLLFK